MMCFIRGVHIKCDEKRPSCSRCVRLKKVCSGYRNEIDLMFRVAVRKPCSNSNGNGRVHLREGVIARSLFPSEDDQTLCYFYTSMIGTIAESDHSRYLHLQLPHLFSRSRKDSALCLAAQAISHAVVGSPLIDSVSNS